MRIPRWLQIAVTVTVLAAVLWRIPVSKLLDEVQSADLVWLLPAFLATLLMLFVRHLKWHRLLRAAGLQVTETDSLRSLLCGFALSVPTPGRVGELGRCLFLPNHIRSEVLQLNVLERVLDAWAVFTFCVLSLVIATFRPVGIFAFAVWLALLPVFLGLSPFVGTISQWRAWRPALRERLRAGSAALANVRTAPFAILALTTTALDLVIFYFLLQALHRTDIATVMVSFPWMIMAGGLPIAAGGIGPREGVAAYLLARRAVPAAAAIDAALLLFVFTAVFPAIAGGMWMLTHRLHNRPESPVKIEATVRAASEES